MKELRTYIGADKNFNNFKKLNKIIKIVTKATSHEILPDRPAVFT